MNLVVSLFRNADSKMSRNTPNRSKILFIIIIFCGV